MAVVVVPWQPGCPHRHAALEWLTDRLDRDHPAWEVRVAELPADGPWVKASAVHAAAGDLRPGDTVVVHDADVYCPGTPAAIGAVLDGAPWAIPHRGVHRLTAGATALVLHGTEPHHDLERTERAYTGVPGGGIVALPAGTLRRVPLDPRFVGWGQEDVSWALALNVLAGHPWRGKAPLWHLYHPPQLRASRKVGSPDSHALHRRYRAARRDPAAMQALVDEGRATWHSQTS